MNEILVVCSKFRFVVVYPLINNSNICEYLCCVSVNAHDAYATGFPSCVIAAPNPFELLSTVRTIGFVLSYFSSVNLLPSLINVSLTLVDFIQMTIWSLIISSSIV